MSNYLMVRQVNPEVFVSSTMLGTSESASYGSPYLNYSCTVTDGAVPEKWTLDASIDSTSEDGYFPLNCKLLVWANCDILNADGTTYLAASEPVPVYA